MVENIQLRCGAHNRYEGELFYGHARRTERRTRPGPSSAPPPLGDQRRRIVAVYLFKRRIASGLLPSKT